MSKEEIMTALTEKLEEVKQLNQWFKEAPLPDTDFYVKQFKKVIAEANSLIKHYESLS
jgi:hypothetical protein